MSDEKIWRTDGALNRAPMTPTPDPKALPSESALEVAREWLSRDSATCYFSFEGYCEDDRNGMVAELAALIEQREAAVRADTLYKCLTDIHDGCFGVEGHGGLLSECGHHRCMEWLIDYQKLRSLAKSHGEQGK
jgi:hypothetical protein